MYNSQYYTCEQIDQRLLQNYLDDYNSQNGTNLTKAQFLTALQVMLEQGLTTSNITQETGESTSVIMSQKAVTDNLGTINSRIAALAAGLDVNISISPTIIYKSVQTSLTLTGTMVNGTPTEMKLMDGSTVLQTSSSSPITKTMNVTIGNNSKAYSVVGTSNGMTLNKQASISARYPIYYGFAASASALAVDANRYAPTTSAAHTYDKTASADGQHFYILVPSDISALSNFTMGGAPFVMNSSTQTINGISYKVYTSGNTYNSGTRITVVAS